MRPLPLLLAVCLLAGCALRGATPEAGPAGAAPPPGDLLVPRMDRQPVLDRQISPGEWDQAASVSGAFRIDDASPAAGTYPFRLWIGADGRNLYVAAVVNATRNPWSWTRVGADGALEGAWYPDVLQLLFTNALEGGLTVPSDRKAFANSREQGSSVFDGYWNGRAWVVQDEGPGEGEFRDGRPDRGTWARGGFTDGALLWEAYVPREPVSPAHDGLRAPDGGAFRMAVAFVRQGPEPHGRGFPRDVHPGPGHTPDDDLRPETWMTVRLAG